MNRKILTMSESADQLPPVSAEPTWQSESRRSAIYNDDALDLMRFLPENSIDCIWTDPPYNLSNDGITCVAGKMVPVNKGEWDRSRGLEGDHQFNLAWTKQCFRILKPTGSIWVTGTLHAHPSVGRALQKNGFRLLNDIIWEKTNPPPNLGRRTFTHSTELLYWASKSQKGDKEKYKFNYEKMKQINGGKQMKTVWKFSSPSKAEKKFGRHPTQKPLSLIKRCLLASTDEDDLVLDPFMGSGSAGVAAINLKRRFIGFELGQEFCRIAIDRMKSACPPPLRFCGRRFSYSGFEYQPCWLAKKNQSRPALSDGPARGCQRAPKLGGPGFTIIGAGVGHNGFQRRRQAQ